MLRASALLDQPRQLDPAHAGHPDVEDDRGEIVAQQTEECLIRGLGADDDALGRCQHGFQRVQVPRLVVNDEDLGRAVLHVLLPYRYNQTRSNDRS